MIFCEVLPPQSDSTHPNPTVEVNYSMDERIGRELLLQAEVSVVPTASSLIIRALKEPKRDRKKVKHGE